MNIYDDFLGNSVHLIFLYFLTFLSSYFLKILLSRPEGPLLLLRRRAELLVNANIDKLKRLLE